MYDQYCIDSVEVSLFAADLLNQVMLAFSYDPEGNLKTASNIFQRANIWFKTVDSLKPLVNFESFKFGLVADKIVQTNKFFKVSSRDTAFNLGQLVCVLKSTAVSSVESLVLLRVNVGFKLQR